MVVQIKYIYNASWFLEKGGFDLKITWQKDAPFKDEIRSDNEPAPAVLHGPEGTVEQEQFHPTTLYQMHLVTQT